VNVLIIGRRGLGKSELASYQASKLNANQIYFDPGNQFHAVDLKTTKLEELKEELENWPDDKPYVISYVPPRGNVEEHWNNFASLLWDFIGEHDGGATFVLIIDEAHRIQSPQSINDWLDEFIRRSPRRERNDSNPIDIIQTTHLPQDLFRVSWSESDYVYFFNVFDKRALKAIDEQYGYKVPDVVELVSHLKTPKTGGREVLEIESETGEHRILTDPEEWHNDIRKPNPPKNAIESTERELGEIYGKTM
jgi:hypothetical protein